MHSDRKPYDLRWALLVARTYEECLPAGAELLRLAFGYSPEYPARLLLSNNAKWERWKKIVKVWDVKARQMNGVQQVDILRECTEMLLPEQLQLIARHRSTWGTNYLTDV